MGIMIQDDLERRFNIKRASACLIHTVDRSLSEICRRKVSKMKGGRKHMKKAALEGCAHLQEGQAVMKVVGLRGSNLIEVEDGEGKRTLCMLPAKFRKSFWIKKGNYVLVSEGDRQKLLESNSKVTGTIMQVLFEENVRVLKMSSKWPSRFTEEMNQTSMPAITLDTVTDNHSKFPAGSQFDSKKLGSDDDDGLPPLHVNSNRLCGIDYYESSSGSEDGSSVSDER